MTWHEYNPDDLPIKTDEIIITINGTWEKFLLGWAYFSILVFNSLLALFILDFLFG